MTVSSTPTDTPALAALSSALLPSSSRSPYRMALALSMVAAVSLGITRFAYGLLLPPMRADLGWSYALAGGMNTANAFGYLMGALAMPALMRRVGPTRLLVGGAVLASVFMAASGFVEAAPALLLQRWLAGIASAWVFVAGGLLAARLGAEHPTRAGLLLGIYYGGTGFGILLSALAVPPMLHAAVGAPHGWAWAWWMLAAMSAAATLVLAVTARVLERQVVHRTTVAANTAEVAGASSAANAMNAAGSAGATDSPVFRPSASIGRFAWALAGYTFFGAGYIGYMTFVIALLREQGASAAGITLFYSLLGVACVASSRLWAGLLDRYRDGRPQALLNALLGFATLMPVLSTSWPAALASGVLFGAVFLSVVASTTALVRHNLPQAQWATGISAFTIAFALGQIVGPTVTGWISDGAGGLARGLVVSAIALWIGAALASRQKPLAMPT